MKMEIPELSLVVLIGASGSGKSTFARKHFKKTEVLSSDHCRGLVSDDENDQNATNDAFDVLHFIAAKRLEAGRLVVVDATNVQPEARKPLVALARKHHVLPVAIVLDLPEKVCHGRNTDRSDRSFGPHVVRQQCSQLHRGLRGLNREGFRKVFVLKSPEDVDSAEIVRSRLWNDRREETGPFDIVGDIHGCYDELVALLGKLGYEVAGTRQDPVVTAPEGRRVVFLGDLVDRGPDTPSVLRLVMHMVGSGCALCIPGNHDVKLMRKLRGRDVRMTHGLAESMQQLALCEEGFGTRVADFIDGLVSHYVLDGGNLVVAHAGMKAPLQGRASGKVRDFALYGETTGETDEFGLPVRYDWAAEYRGRAHVVYGHTPVPEAEWLNRTICIDTGCVFGGKLTALRYPEKELVEVLAHRQYYEPAKPLRPAETAPLRRYQDLLDLDDVLGKRIIDTRISRTVTVREENAMAALEVMSRFAVDPHWLIYLPPTMSPTETPKSGAYLEHPNETFGYFRSQGVSQVICEEKHMGSRTVVIACRSPEDAAKRFGVSDGRAGIVYTRTGRPFFDNRDMEEQVLSRVVSAMDAAGLWETLQTDWVCLDAELMPWSAKAQSLLRLQYAPTGAAAQRSLAGVVDVLGAAASRVPEAQALLDRFKERQGLVDRYVAAYQQYCWPVQSVGDLKLAPFHLLASEGACHTDKDHDWHMQILARLAAGDPMIVATPYRRVAVDDEASVAEATRWWEELTAAGGEGMVVKPLDWIVRGKKGLVQPALKCRGPEYLRIIYGPEYSAPENLERLRSRRLGVKRSLAQREFALGIEALQRFVAQEPLYRVHECVFGVLALESEPVDPRL